MAKHYHAIPAVLRGNSYGNKPTIITTEYGDIEEGCLKRIVSVFSDDEKEVDELEAMLATLVSEYESHLKLAEATVEAVKASRTKPAVAAKVDELDAVFDEFLKGDFIKLAAYIKGNAQSIKKLRCYTHGKVAEVAPGQLTMVRDNDKSYRTLAYPLSTKLKVGDHIFLRDDGAKPIPTVMAVWVNVKDAPLRAGQLKQFF